MGIGGRMYNWILEFLSNRTFHVKVVDGVSNDLYIVNGIPQGRAII